MVGPVGLLDLDKPATLIIVIFRETFLFCFVYKFRLLLTLIRSEDQTSTKECILHFCLLSKEYDISPPSALRFSFYSSYYYFYPSSSSCSSCSSSLYRIRSGYENAHACTATKFGAHDT